MDEFVVGQVICYYFLTRFGYNNIKIGKRFNHVNGKVVVVTGGANRIGEALGRRFVNEGARGIALAGIDGERVASVAGELDALGVQADVTSARE